MSQKHTLDELNNLSREELITMVLTMQGQLDTLNDNIEKLIEQVRLANSYRFGKHSEKLSVIEGQMSFFDEADAVYDNSAAEPEADEVISVRKKKTRGQRELDLKDFPVDVIPTHSVSEEESLMNSLEKETGEKCRMKHTNAFGTNRNPGQWNCIP